MRTIAVLGLGYVGLGLATAFGQKNTVYGYDINTKRIAELKQHIEKNYQVSKEVLKASSIHFTSNIVEIKNANFFIVTVSTPANFYETPDLTPLISTMTSLGSILKKGDIVVLESTVYPGTTEEICIPILEKVSHLKCQEDFQVGYSPERINPSDSVHTLKNITKVIAAQNQSTLDVIRGVYQSICDKVHPVRNIAIAESIKLLENTQRDVNIAFINEFAKIMHALNLNTHEVLEGAKTKWSYVPYKPGFVGGHCISIDPHYLAFKAKQYGVFPELILTARKINDNMTQFVIQSMLKILIQHNLETKHLHIGIFGISYKENTHDIRNSLSLKLVKELKEYGFKCYMHDPMNEAFLHDGTPVSIEKMENMKNLSVLILVVGHDFYKRMGLKKLLKSGAHPKILMDIPHLFVEEHRTIADLIYWNL